MSEQVNVQVTVDTATAKCAANMEFIKQAANVIDDYDNIVTLAPVLNTVATDLNEGDDSNIKAVGEDLNSDNSNVNAVGEDLQDDDSNIKTVADDLSDAGSNITAVASDLKSGSSKVNAVGTDLNKGNSSYTKIVSDDLARGNNSYAKIVSDDIKSGGTNYVNTVANDIKVGGNNYTKTVATNMPTISTAVSMQPAISTVVSMEPAISTTTTHMTEITNVATNMHSVTTTASLAPTLSTVTTNMTTITAVATDLASPSSDIKNAISAASTATTKATEASNSAHEASTKAQIATAKASNAASSATTASTAATTATSAMTTATTAATTATQKATEAVSSASTASTQATIATSAMSTATTAATTATQKATAAATSESNARTYASTATAQANIAEQQANLARRYAQETHGASDVTFSNLRALPAINNYEYPQTDEDGLNDLIEEYRSTFDLSKFTGVGSLTITADGIFTGASSSAVECPISISNGQKTVIKLSYKHKNGTNPQFLFCTLDNNENSKGLFIYADTNNDINVFYNDTTHIVDNFDLIENTEYALELKTDYKTYVTLIIDGVEKYNATGLSLAYGANNNAILGNNVVIANNRNILGSIDLKQFSITVDGVPVFSGNQTGIDTIKADNYTVVGTPTISTDGIASGFSATKYVSCGSITTSSNDFEVKCSFTTGSNLDSPVYQYIWSMGTSSSDMCGILLVYGKITATSRNTHFSPITDTITLSTNKKYYTKFKVKSGIVTLSISEDDVTYTDYTTSLTTNFSSALDMFIGFEKDTADNPFAGSIDLNAFKIYVNGDLVYQPCLKIPYTLSKTGSKVVNSVYRDRVNDMYEQFGYANYFTLKNEVKRYTKVGNLTLTDEGKASNFDSGYIGLDSFKLTAPFEIDFGKVTTGSSNIRQDTLLGCASLSALDSTIGDFRVKINDAGQWQILGLLTTNVSPAANTDYWIKAGIDSSYHGYLKISTDGVNYTTYTGTTPADTSLPYAWRLGVDETSDYWTGSIDDIYNITITYGGKTLSLYEKANFTIPQGSTYGYLQKLTRQNVTDTTSTSVTLAKAKGNTDYHYGTLTSLTITANETSDYETNIYFTAGNSISVSLPNTLNYIGTTPSFSASTSYVMSILNNILVVGEVA